jgi:hypothetical protein
MTKDNMQVYKDFCSGRFQRMEERFISVEKKLSDVHNVITNGLVDKVRNTQRVLWLLFVLIVGFLTTQIALFNMIAKHVSP